MVKNMTLCNQNNTKKEKIMSDLVHLIQRMIRNIGSSICIIIDQYSKLNIKKMVEEDQRIYWV
jgi:hypothetical protein